MQFRVAARTAAGLALAFATALIPVVPAGAETLIDPAPPAAKEPAAIEEHCAIGLDAVAAADRAGAEAPEPVCFSSLDEVDRYLAEQTTDDGSRLTAAAAASVAVGRVYKDASKGGSSLTFWGSNGCAGVTFGFPSLSSGWNTSISSLTGLNGCWATAYAATSYSGTRANCTPYCATLGSLNDRVKSLVFRPTGSLG
ncbi:hypothetical protein [Agromyces sp. S2-1-8]|jgi:hypothetical protein|uniref:hypothetical protein n=1 Tax=Agromyces sp. S2-1-8 TaxID=2897180 RepID=UPI001E50F89B|nr:hypothetical protein [Agromyces sp. S2-1-8]MCD5346191.1 hypothetical protein [Agromyces sp. S2-1-8]